MRDDRFGGTAAGLLQRLRPPGIGVADLREVASDVLPVLARPGLRLDMVQRVGSPSVVVLEEDERCLRVHLDELADDMTRAGVAPTHAGISAALSSWVAHRPVTDAAAAAFGIAVLDWRDSTETSVGWRVVVRRGEFALPWAPSGAPGVHQTRSAATERAHDVGVELRVEGPVALWAHPVLPMLATAAVVAPERMLDRIEAAGLHLPDMHVVITPHRPVACAEPAIAARLAGETTEACVTLPWRSLADLPWI